MVDIADTAKINEDYFRAIRGNPSDVYKQGSAGDEYMIAYHAWIELSGDQVSVLRNDKALSAWMESTLRLRTSNIQRLRQLLKDNEWNYRVFRFCKMRWSREKFAIDNWIKIIGTRLPQVSDLILKCLWTTTDRTQYWEKYLCSIEEFLCKWLTPRGAIAASVADLELIDSVYPYDPDAALRVLFYPMKHDLTVTRKGLPIEANWFEGGHFDE